MMNQTQASSMQALAKYTRVDVQTSVDDASSYRLIQMLMEGALARVTAAKLCLQQNNTPRKGENISSAISIIGALRDSLDHEVGGEIAANLESLYEYMTHRLVEANLKNNAGALTEVHSLLLEIKSAWDAIGETAEVKSLVAQA